MRLRLSLRTIAYTNRKAVWREKDRWAEENAGLGFFPCESIQRASTDIQLYVQMKERRHLY
jgi:hypothetical protein